MRGRMMRRLRSRRGFTLAELLMTMVILLLVTAMVASTIPVVKDLLDRTVDAANARTLLSTTVTMLRDELSLAQPVRIKLGDTEAADGESGTEVTYISGKTGAQNTIYGNITEDDVEKGIQIQEYEDRLVNWADDVTKPARRSLVSDAAATKTLRIQFTGIKYEDGVYTINGLQVIRKKDNTVLVTLDNLEIRNIQKK